jgi:hypothetical protein
LALSSRTPELVNASIRAVGIVSPSQRSSRGLGCPPAGASILTAASGTIPTLLTSAQADHTLGSSHPGIDKGEQHHSMRMKLR